MPAPSTPPPLEHLGTRPFSFYPPILNIEHNEWQYQRSTWSEMLVSNVRSGLELWIPRQFLGEISRVDEPVMIVGLNRELEYKAGQVWPYERRVLQVPKAINDTADSATDEPVPESLSTLQSITGSGSSPEPRVGRLILTAAVVGVLACFVVISVVRIAPLRPKVVFTAKDQSFLELNRESDYFDIVKALGNPKEDRWRSGSGELQFRVLTYPDRGYSVILMGPDKDSMRYIGCVDQNWRVVHSVDSPRGGSTLPLLRSIKPF
ncbi:MAG: hypothetical protein IRZ15_04605 [Bryobacteraceae bacterium]|nr:hypothetical protein [Bryobacteraceae bacterium]